MPGRIPRTPPLSNVSYSLMPNDGPVTWPSLECWTKLSETTLAKSATADNVLLFFFNFTYSSTLMVHGFLKITACDLYDEKTEPHNVFFYNIFKFNVYYKTTVFDYYCFHL